MVLKPLLREAKMKISTVEQMRALDREAITKYGIPDSLLMENAGHAVYFVILNLFRHLEGRRFTIFCGPGNNGGDGLVVARKLNSNGAAVTIFLLGEEEKFKGTAKENLEIVKKLSIPLKRLSFIGQVPEVLADSDAVVDAMLGTGLSRLVGGLYREAVGAINHAGKPVFSVDIPSGINGDTGQVMGEAVRADYTVTFGLPKQGNLLYPGFEYCGRLFVTHISFPPKLIEKKEIRMETGVPPGISSRAPESHKGDYGKVLFIAGSQNYLGAPRFSALSFLKAGGGLAYLATPKSLAPFLGSAAPELVLFPLWETETGSVSDKNLEGLLTLSERMDMVIIGPGLSLDEPTQTLVRALVEKLLVPVLLDGDGITAVAGFHEGIAGRHAPTILTPHLGEMSRLTGKSVEEIKKRRIDILRETATAMSAEIVLKGAHSLVGSGDGKVWLNLSGNPGMATAGSGDVLTGCIGAMAGRGMPLRDTVRTGVFLHGLAGDLAAEEKGEDGVTAGDLMAMLPRAVKTFRESSETFQKTCYGKISVI